MRSPSAGELWLVRPAGSLDVVAAIRSREKPSWTALSTDGELAVVPQAVAVRPIPGPGVPAGTTWNERVALLAGFARPLVGARA